MQHRENGCDVAKTRFFSNDPGKCILNKLYRQARFETDVPARRELHMSG